MKRVLFYTLTGIIICLGSFASASDFLGEVVLTAQQYVSEAFNQPQIQDPRHLQAINQIVKVLFTKDQFALVQGNMKEDFSYCSRNKRQRVLAFLDKNKVIKICPRAQSFSKEDLAQVLIHEAVHQAFGFSHRKAHECRTTMWEVNLTRLGGGRPFANRYIRDCNLQRLGPFREIKVKGFREPALSLGH